MCACGVVWYVWACVWGVRIPYGAKYHIATLKQDAGRVGLAVDDNALYRASLRALVPITRPPRLWPHLPPLTAPAPVPALPALPPLPPPLPPLPPALDWIEVDDVATEWPKLGTSPKPARATAGAAAVTINKVDVARLARVACGGGIWNTAPTRAGAASWKDWDLAMSPSSVLNY